MYKLKQQIDFKEIQSTTETTAIHEVMNEKACRKNEYKASGSLAFLNKRTHICGHKSCHNCPSASLNTHAINLPCT